MLNWIVFWVGSYLFGHRRPAPERRRRTPFSPVLERHRREGASLPVFWGDPLLQGLHIGFFIALGGARRLLGHHSTARRSATRCAPSGINPEAARYGGISVARNYFLAMAIAGVFAGLAGAIDILGWQFRLDITTIQGRTIGFIGIAVALLGRNTAVGVGFAALLFAALQTGTASRNLDPSVFNPELAAT